MSSMVSDLIPFTRLQPNLIGAMGFRLSLALLLKCRREGIRVRTRGDFDIFVSCREERRCSLLQLVCGLLNAQLAGSSCAHCSHTTVSSSPTGRLRRAPQSGQNKSEPESCARSSNLFFFFRGERRTNLVDPRHEFELGVTEA